MLQITIGQTILLVKGDASITDTVKAYHVAHDLDGNVAVVGVSLVETGNYYRLTKEYNWSDNVWTVDEINGEAPTYTMPEIEAIGDLIENFPSIR